MFTSLPADFQVGAQVRSLHFSGRRGTIVRIVASEGELGGLVEVKWDDQKRVSRSAGFFSPREVEVVR
jgi:hypothetical protein